MSQDSLSIEEADKLINQYVKLKQKIAIEPTDDLMIQFRKHQTLCVQKFRYIVLMRTSRYKNFNNYDDLNQEGLEALVKALNSYNPVKRGNVFWWIHKYVDTRISRCANLHTAIRFPLKYAKANVPFRESVLPLLVDTNSNAHDLLEERELLGVVKNNLGRLSGEQQEAVKMLFGIDAIAPKSFASVCRELKISRLNCKQILGEVADILKEHVRL